MSYNDLIVLASGKDCIAHHNRTASKLGIPEEKIPNEPPKTISTTENYPDYSRINKTIQGLKKRTNNMRALQKYCSS